MADRPHILIVGGGYVGLYTAFHLQKSLHRGQATVTVVDPTSTMTYQPFLPEAAAGSIEPRHVVIPLRRVLRRTTIVAGRVSTVDHHRHVAAVAPAEGDPYELPYDVLVMAVGSVSRTLPIPGLAEVGVGFQTIGEAILLRNRVLSRLDLAASGSDAARRRRALTFIFVGGGYGGVEAFAELEDMASYALRYYPELRAGDMRWILVEATGRILPEVSVTLAAYTVERLTERGMDVRLNTRLESATAGRIKLSDGAVFDADTLVWTAGVRANPLIAASTGLPVDDKGRVIATAELRMRGLPDAWSAGDCAAVPDLSKGEPALCGPSAQHAVRQAKRLAANITAALRGAEPKPYKHSYAGSVASLGLHKGAAEIYGIRLRGFPAWFMHRTYHVSRVPTLNRKARIIADWTLALFFRREVVPLEQIQSPRAAFESAARE